MMLYLPITVLVILIIQFLSVKGQDCPRACRCDSRRTVYCLEKNLYTVPYGIPETTETLFLQGNQIRNGPVTDEIISSLENLVKLDLHQNKLTSFPSDLPSTLQYVSLRRNQIKYVGKTSLKGLHSLNELHLDENNITNKGLATSAFKDTDNLEVLVLSNNLLTKFPGELPVSLRHLRMDNNRIQVIERASLERLTNLINLDLSNNRLDYKNIDSKAMLSLSTLRYLDMSYNHLTEIPKGLPGSLTELMLSNNRIEYIYETENGDHGSLQRLPLLSKLDLSSNNLRSVMNSAFDTLHLRTAELQDNPWQCDCHLRYLKKWITTTQSVLSSESNIRCNSPSAFLDVTLDSIDPEALSCDSRTNTRYMMKVVDVGQKGFRVLWKNHEDTPDPPFITRTLMIGPLRCQNCSFAAGEPASQVASSRDVTSWLASYSFQDMTSAILTNPKNASVTVDRLQPATHYAVCVFDSEQDANTLTNKQCVDVWTSAYQPTTSPAHGNKAFSSIWIIVLCCAVVLFVVVGFTSYVLWKRRRSLKTKTPRIYRNREELYYPGSYLQAFTRPVGYTSPSQQYQHRHIEYGTNMSDRTYAECGPATSTNQRPVRESAVDATMDFDVLLQPGDRTSPKRLHTPTSSYGESRDDGTLSTNRTRLSTSHEQLGSPPPTYDSLHSFDCVGQRPSITSGSITPRLGQDTGCYV